MNTETITKEYLEIGGLTLKIEFYYSMGGMNYFTSRTERRGYYLSVSPVEIGRDENGRIRSESYMGFSGIKECILEVKRKSKKSELEAEKHFSESRKKLVNHILEKNNLLEHKIE